MFKKLRDRFTQGGKIDTLVSMGFNRDQADEALRVCDGNVERAAAYLLEQGSSSTDMNNSTVPTSSYNHASTSGWSGGNNNYSTNTPSGGAVGAATDDDEELRMALEASLQTEEARHLNEALTISRPSNGGPMSKAGQAAAERAAKANSRYGANGIQKNKTIKKTPAAPSTGTKPPPPPTSDPTTVKTSGNRVVLNHHHPNVTMPTQMKDKSKEEQILRCAERLAPYAAAVDTLIIALRAIRDDPANSKYRKVDKTTAGYQRVLKDTPGAEHLLLAMNFQKRGTNELVMERSQVDVALLYLGLSALQKAQDTTEYMESKQSIAFQKEMKSVQQSSSEDEKIKRANLLSKCPSEPTDGALIQCQLDENTVIRRRFDGDDILLDVIHWIGAHGSVIPENIASRKWSLVDMNRYPVTPIDISKLEQKTLQYIGCWPSGRLEIRPSPPEWKNNSMEDSNDTLMVGSSRGLGAATSTML